MTGFWRWHRRQPLLVRGLVAFAATAAVFGVGVLLDRPLYDRFNDPRIYERDWSMLLRVQGFLGTWVAVALATWLQERPRDPARAARLGQLVLGAPVLGGALAELLKIVIRRARPMLGDGEYVFRPWDDRPFSSAGLALPSSHTMVAFAGATMLARLFPRARWVFYALAWGCGLTRVVARAHFASDVALGAVLGWAVGWGLWLRFSPAPAEAPPRAPAT